MNNFITDMDGKSLDINAERLTQLRAIFPEVFSEDKVDFQRLKQALGEDTYVKGEHYELSWAGKSEARKEVQKQTTATLIPDRENSIDFDNAQNIFIEGENLEVLRVLQKSYFGKVKMIYIDPPYNTGNDSFVYPDDYSERQEEYKKRTGITDGEGFLNKQDLWKKNTKENGQFHSVWLSMMYPRLYLSRNLLKEDGVIFISIDDNEVSNLKLLCDEIFGEENFIDIFNWAKSETPANLSKKSKKIIEYVLCYQKSKNDEKFTGVKKNSISSNGLLNQTNKLNILTFPANFVKTKISDQVILKGKYGTESYEIDLLEDTETQNGIFIKPVALKAKFKWSQNNLDNEIKNGTQISIPTLKLSPSYEKMEYDAEVPPNLINSKVGVGTNENAGVHLEKILERKAFDFPKPVSLIKYLMKFSDDKNGIYLDFFSGSGTLAEAVVELNNEDEGNRSFICVQMPELVESETEAYKAGFRKISEITINRIHKLFLTKSGEIKFPSTENKGFKCFKIGSSNFKIWRSDIIGKKQIFEQLDAFRETSISNMEENMLFEIILKLGLGLNNTILRNLFNQNGWFLINNKIIVILSSLDIKYIDKIINSKCELIIILDSLFQNNDNFKTNFTLQLHESGVKYKSI